MTMHTEDSPYEGTLQVGYTHVFLEDDIRDVPVEVLVRYQVDRFERELTDILIREKRNRREV